MKDTAKYLRVCCAVLLALLKIPAGGGCGTASAASTLSENFVQLRSGSRMLDFAPGSISVKGRGATLIETFSGTPGVAPLRGTDGQVHYSGLWPGVNLTWEIREHGIAESIYQISPGADVGLIRLFYNFAVTLSPDGGLRFSPQPDAMGYFSTTAPLAWQENGKQRIPVAVHYSCYDDQSIGFQVGSYDRSKPLFIDPVYEYHTFFGSIGDDYSYDIAVDGGGSVYVTGTSGSSWNGPGTWMPPLPLHGHSGSGDIFVIKFSSTGAYQWHTFFGSSSYDGGQDIVVDDSGNVFVTGRSSATWNGPGGELPKHDHGGGSNNIVLLKLDKDGGYLYHTFYGGNTSTIPDSLVLDSSNDLLILASSDASWKGPSLFLDLPKNSHSGGFDIALLKLSGDGEYLYHTFYGSSLHDTGNGLTVDEQGGISIAGYSNAIWLGPGNSAPLNGFHGNGEIVVLKLDSGGNYQWHTFYGCGVLDESRDVISDDVGNLYVVGASDGAWNGPGDIAPLNAYSGSGDIVLLSLDSTGKYNYHTFFGSTNGDIGWALARDSRGSLWIAGRSQGEWQGPEGQKPLNSYAGDSDIMVMKLSGTGHYQAHTFLGSADRDGTVGIAADSQVNIYLCGYSDQTWDGPGSIPPIRGHSGGTDFFTMKMTAPFSFPWVLFMPALFNPTSHNTQ